MKIITHDLIFYCTHNHNSIAYATVDSQCLEYLGYITLFQGSRLYGWSQRLAYVSRSTEEAANLSPEKSQQNTQHQRVYVIIFKWIAVSSWTKIKGKWSIFFSKKLVQTSWGVNQSSLSKWFLIRNLVNIDGRSDLVFTKSLPWFSAGPQKFQKLTALKTK